ncbi:efflux protein [Apiospora sp. TS-2023a]
MADATQHVPHSGPEEGFAEYLARNRASAPSLKGVKDPDFLAIGLGGTNMLAMLWAIASGRRAVGVEVRGDPFLGIHWNIRVDLYHQLGLIDQMMLERYGETRLPKKMDGSLFRLADTFYSVATKARDVIADAIIDGLDAGHHLTGRILHIEFIDDRWKDGKPQRTVTFTEPPPIPERPEPQMIRTDMQAILDGPSTWQAAANSIQLLLRRYLEKLEEIDLKSGKPPRVRLFTKHRVIQDGSGFSTSPCGRTQVRIEEVSEILEFNNKVVRIRTPGSESIDIGIPELFSISTGINCQDAERLGFRQHDVKVDHHDGQGPKVAQADYIAAQIEVLVHGRLRRRIASEFDERGNEYWVRSIAVGHENDPEVCWLLVEVPEFETFCPVEKGILPRDTCHNSQAYFSAYQALLYDYYIEKAALILEIPVSEMRRVSVLYGPKPFSLVERTAEDARVAANGVVAGDSLANGHFLHSAGAMCGMIGHAYRFLEYWLSRDADPNQTPDAAIRVLADQIKRDSDALLAVSAKEFSQAVPSNFGAERGERVAAASGIRRGMQTVAEVGG